ncbi:AI-2E family transporter [Colwellia echini]|uniref:AI-2E family transporter n=1 Tax=Colwellia echini TaxID=1982103 RepID=A0ABY3MZM1_9GAMM|nr:AI-2E family transporter [Colwellia echini]TYK66678.1 AI-2E family transporter [Colwellia echini]
MTSIPQEKKPINKSLVCHVTLTILAVVYTAYFAQELILLLVASALISLLLSSGVNTLERLYVPRVLGAVFLLCCLIIPTSALVVQLEEPITKWTKMLPQVSTHISKELDKYQDIIDINSSETVDKTAEESDKWFSWFEEKPKVETSSENKSMIQNQLKESLFSFAGEFMVLAPFALMQLLTAVILILFTLVYSPKLFRHYVQLFVEESEQNNAFKFVRNVQQQLSRYILTVSLINVLLALLAMILFTCMGLEDALLWGLIVGFVNFIPFVGPAFALSAIALASSVQWGMDVNVLIVVGGVLLLNILESQLITPLVLSKNMRINPFIIIVWLLIIGWLWGLIGLLIAVPLLVCIKLILTLFEQTQPWVKFLET